MSYEPVTVTQYRAKDGSLHGSRAAAEAHDKWEERRMLVAEMRVMVANETWDNEFSEFCGYQHMNRGGSEWERESRNEAIVQIIIDKWAEFSAVMSRLSKQEA